MKKIALILATVMVVAVSSIYAQNHRHTDRSNTTAIESIASSNSAALDTMSSPDIEEQFRDLVEDNTDFTPDSYSGDDASIAKTAIAWVFGVVAIVFLSPVFIVAIILYFIHKNRKMKNDLAMAAIQKGVPVPDETKIASEHAAAQSAAQQNVSQHPKPQVSKMERAIKKLALGAGFCIGGWFLHINILTAIGLGYIVYAIGLICIDQFVDKKTQSSDTYNKVEHHDEKPE